jgi:hypothetical protein
MNVAAPVLDGELGTLGHADALAHDLDAERRVGFECVRQPAQFRDHVSGCVDTLDIPRRDCLFPWSSGTFSALFNRAYRAANTYPAIQARAFMPAPTARAVTSHEQMKLLVTIRQSCYGRAIADHVPGEDGVETQGRGSTALGQAGSSPAARR